MDARNVQIELVYDNVDISRDVDPFVINLRYVDRTSPDRMDELSVTFQDVDGLWHCGWLPERGAKFAAKIKAFDWFNEGDSFERDCGSFEIDDYTSSSTPQSTFAIGAVSVGITNSIRRQQNCKAWENVDIETIAGDIAKAHEFELKFLSGYNPVLDRWEQKSKSDLSALIEICEYAGLSVKITDKHLIVFRGEEFDNEDPEITLSRDDDCVKSWNFNANSSDIYSAAEVKYYDPDKKELIEYIYVPDGISGLKAGIKEENLEPIPEPEVGQILKINRRVSSIAEAQEVTRAALRNKNMRQMKGSLSLMGRPDLYSGMNINLEGFGRWDTVVWNIEEIAHNYDGGSGGYNSTLSLRGILGY